MPPNNVPSHADSQRKRILDYLLAGNSITRIEAEELFGCYELPTRIWEIENWDRVSLDHRREKNENTCKKFMRYSIIKPSPVKLAENNQVLLF
jgi:hypothetical protein